MKKKSIKAVISFVSGVILSILLLGNINVYAGDYPDADEGRSWLFDESIQRVYDQADILTDEEESNLEAYYDQLSGELNFNITLVTTNNLNGKTTMAYADDVFDSLFGINTDGCMFLRYINGSEKEVWISTSGTGIICLYDDYIDFIYDEITDDFYEEDYYSAFGTYATLTEKTVSRYNETGEPVDIKGGNSGQTFYYDEATGEFFYYDSSRGSYFEPSFGAFLKGCIFPMIIGLIVALCVTASWKSKLKSVAPASGAKPYENDGSFELRIQTDTYIRTSVSKIRIDTSSGSSGHSSSTHHSSSGGSHGGGGRHM